MTENQNAVML